MHLRALVRMQDCISLIRLIIRFDINKNIKIERWNDDDCEKLIIDYVIIDYE